MLESAANCCLSCFEANNKLLKDIEKLPPISKLDLFALHEYNKKIDYGRSEVKKIKEIKQLRDKIVHPKVAESKIGKFGTGKKNFMCLVSNKIFSPKLKPATNITEISTLWSLSDCISALESIINFFNYFFDELLEMDKGLVFGILNDSLILDGKTHTSLYPETIFEDIKYLKIKNININFMVNKP
jgi:glutaredoxin 2